MSAVLQVYKPVRIEHHGLTGEGPAFLHFSVERQRSLLGQLERIARRLEVNRYNMNLTVFRISQTLEKGAITLLALPLAAQKYSDAPFDGPSSYHPMLGIPP
nr:hypothetical protein [Hyphomonas sp. 34-62-18]